MMRLSRELTPDVFDALLREYQRLLRRLFEEMGGREVEVSGDSARAAFPTAKQAALAAVAAQRAVAAHVEPEPEDAWLLQELDATRRDFFAALPRRVTINVDGLGSVLFCHGSPRSADEIITAITPAERLSPMLEDVDERVVVCGHTHVQFDRLVAGMRVVNAGSVGMPYEDAPGARWAMLGPEADLRRTEYDREQAADRLRASSWGRVDEFVEKYLFAPPAAVAATEHFERMAVAGE